MSAVEKLNAVQEKNNSYICLGLDLDPKKMPPDSTLSIKSMYGFAMNIVEATKDHVCAYKPNLAFYEHLGHEGLSLLESIVKRIPDNIPIILDCKRGDIGNTASFYAEAMFEKMNADWVTLSPYMGYDSMRPFLEYEDKGVFVLCLTSNSGSKDFQLLDVGGKPLYEIVAEKVDYWNKENNCGLVVGATNPEQLKVLRVIAKDMPLLIPGVGAQGGSLEKSLLYGTDNFKKLAVINVSRSVLYASNGADYAEKARDELIKLNTKSQKIKSGETTETTEQIPEQIQQESETKTQVQGFTPPPQSTQTEKPVEEAAPIEQSTPPSAPQQETTPPTVQPEPPAVVEPEKPSEELKQETKQAEPQTPPPPIPTSPQIPQINRDYQEQAIQPEKQEQAETPKPVEQEAPAVQSEPKRTPPPLPTPPPILPPNPEVMRRNREEQERRLKALHEQKLKQQNGDSTESNSSTEDNESATQENSSEQESHKQNFQSRGHNRNNR
ncbi:MAG TPA: orotidine-5'-phosphate decarboxylase [candidate division Zixibacteria bacterium]|nr:orotidine-5'-phosphate decarboxylase [candidate division Zixibacteria bacterium]